jgi:DNA-binding CsgD family transcriptional regulator
LENIEFYDELNEREKTVAEYISSGFSSKEIAQMLHVTPKYTYNIRSRIRAKLCVLDKEELMEWFRNAGFSEKP